MTKRILSVRIDPAVDTALRNLAESADVTVTELVEKALIDMIGVCPMCGQDITRNKIAFTQGMKSPGSG